jgi:hypothetical protein
LYLGVISGGMAVIKKDLGGMRVRINVLGGMAVICRIKKDHSPPKALITKCLPFFLLLLSLLYMQTVYLTYLV